MTDLKTLKEIHEDQLDFWDDEIPLNSFHRKLRAGAVKYAKFYRKNKEGLYVSTATNMIPSVIGISIICSNG